MKVFSSMLIPINNGILQVVAKIVVVLYHEGILSDPPLRLFRYYYINMRPSVKKWADQGTGDLEADSQDDAAEDQI